MHYSRQISSLMTINQIYEMYHEATKTPLSQTQFRRMWTELFKDVIKVTNYRESIQHPSNRLKAFRAGLDDVSLTCFLLFFYLFQTNWFSKCGICFLITTVAHRDKTLPPITKHFHKCKTLPPVTKHFYKSQNTSTNEKTLPRIQNTSTNQETLPQIQTLSPITKHLLGWKTLAGKETRSHE